MAGERADRRHVWGGARACGEGVLGVQRRAVQGSLAQRVLHAMRCLSPIPYLTLPPTPPCTMPVMPLHTRALSRMPSWLDASATGQHACGAHTCHSNRAAPPQRADCTRLPRNTGANSHTDGPAAVACVCDAGYSLESGACTNQRFDYKWLLLLLVLLVPALTLALLW